MIGILPPKKLLSLMLMVFIIIAADAQKQLVLLKGEKVKLRLYPGDEFIFKLKNGKRKWVSYVNNLSDTSVVTHRDTIPFHKIDRIYFAQSKLYNRIGSALIVLGTALFLIDQFNYVVVQGNEPDLDAWVTKVTLTSIGVGLPLVLIKPKSQKLNYRYRLMTVSADSPFYVPDSRGYISPYMDN